MGREKVWTRVFAHRPVRLVFLGVLVALVVSSGAPSASQASNTAYRDAVLADSPSAYYRLGEAAGSTSAASSAGTAPSLALDAGSSVAFGAQGSLRAPNIADTAVQFTTGSLNGGNDAAFNLIGGDWTIDFWMLASPGTPRGYVVSKFCLCGGQPWGYTVALEAAGTLSGEIWQPGAPQTPGVYGALSVADSRWHHVVFRRSSGVLSLYVDAALDVSATPPINGANAAGAPFRVSGAGSGAGAIQTYAGRVDEVALYKQALSSSRIQAHYEAGKGAPQNTSIPAVTGTAQDGQTLTASSGTWDSPSTVSYAYQWRRCDSGGSSCSDIGGATSSTYALTQADVGATIRVAVTAANNQGSAQATSAATSSVAAAPPSNTSLPTISGTTQDGQTLTSTDGAWSGTPTITYTRQWQRCDAGGANCADISGATATTYTLAPADVGKTIRVAVTADNAAPGSVQAASAATSVVAAAPPSNTGLPTISGTTRDGQTLTSTNGTWTGTPTITYTRQWRRCDAAGANCADISGASATTYTLAPADVGKTIRVAVTAANAAPGSTTATSAASAVVDPDPPANQSTPTISGTAQDGQTLSTTYGSWSGTTPRTYSVQWQDCDSAGNNCTAIAGATGSAYTLASSDVGYTVRAAVTASNAAGSATAASAQTGIVQALPPLNITAPSVSGTARSGQALTMTQGSWSGSAPLTYSYQWRRCDLSGASCVSIAGATATTYTLTDDDVNSTIRGQVTASNASLPGGGSGSVSSGPTARINVLLGAGALGYFSVSSRALNDRMTLSVNDGTGNLHLKEHDLKVAGTGIDLSVDRYYDSLQPASRDLGPGWTAGMGGDVRVRPYTDGSVVLYGPGGYVVNFINQGGTLLTPTGVDSTLVHNGDGTYSLSVHKSGDTYRFASTGVLTSLTDKNGNQIAYSYSSGQLSTITDTQGRQTSLGSDGNGQLTSMTDSAGRQYGYSYDANGDFASYTDAAGNATNFVYDSAHRLTQITTPGAHVTTITYDGTSRRVASIKRVTNPSTGAGDTTTYDYNTAGASAFCSGASSSTVVTDPNGHQTTACFDSTGRQIKVKDALGNTTTTLYNADSQITRQTSPKNGVTLNTYDANNNLTRSVMPTGATRTSAYADSAHPYYPTQATDAQGNTTTYAYDTNGNLTTITDALPAQNKITRVFNPNGTEASYTDPNGNTTTYGYDSQGNRTSKTPPGPLGPETYTHDALSREATATDGKGQTTSSTYDALDRATGETYADGSTVTHTYDTDGNATSTIDSSGTTTNTYDAQNRLVTTADPNGHTVSTGYDATGNTVSQTDAGGTVSYTYDAANRVTGVTDPGAATPIVLGYDADGNRTSTATPNGMTITSTYDLSDRLTQTVARGPAGQTLKRVAYAYTSPTGSDSALRSQLTDDAGAATTYTYDQLNRLTRAATATSAGVPGNRFEYQYDGAGNRLLQIANGVSTIYAYNNANQLTAAGDTSYTFDANGNQTSPTSAAGFTNPVGLAYNAKDQTVTETAQGGVTSPPGTPIPQKYAGSEQTDRLSSGSTTFTNVPSDPPQVDAATTPSGATYFTRDPFGTLLDERTTGSTYYYILDGQGSVLGLTDASGSLANSYSYEPYGKLATQTETVPNAFRFQGQYQDTTGLYHMGARFYDPGTARWTQQDPISHEIDPTQTSAYTFASSDPVNRQDSSGLYPICNRGPCPPPYAWNACNIGTYRLYGHRRVNWCRWLFNNVFGRSLPDYSNLIKAESRNEIPEARH
ncbi:MAG: hypothetical protein QOJ97_253 [Solirubrobacteraceae bacterium]|jgi:RHS repeat-associated protein|nr:hypothetical protein [Solirubrobacteraceae bacterium]